MMKFPDRFTMAGLATAMTAVLLCLASSLDAQTQTKKNATKKATKATTNAPPPAPPRGPLTRADIERLWKGPDALLLNEIKNRGLGFEPEEEWLSALDQSKHPDAAAQLKAAIAEAPAPEATQAAAAELFAKIKEAAQKRDDKALEELLHPELLTEKAKVYVLFDTAQYRSHSLGRFSPMPNRRVGVQFFQLTSDQVERLNYVFFSTFKGKIVVRDVLNKDSKVKLDAKTEMSVADLYLRDEKAVALAKIELVFRAFNDGDATALKNLCTPGLFDKLQDFSNGARLTRGIKLTLQNANVVMSVDTDHKSIRPVARVGFSGPGGRRIEFDVDFERISDDYKVVRIRDTQNHVIAWDPNIDNFLNRRYNIPDGPIQDPPALGMCEMVWCQPLAMVRQLVDGALLSGDVNKLRELAQELTESLPASGEGQGVRVAVNLLSAKFAEARQDALTTIQRGGTVWVSTLHHRNTGETFRPVVLAISKEKVLYRLVGADSSEPTEIAMESITEVYFDKGSKLGRKPTPLLRIKFKVPDGKKTKDREYGMAAMGTACAQTPGLVLFGGSGVCPDTGNTKSSGLGGLGSILGGAGPTYVRPDWQQYLQVVQQTLEEARKKK